MTWPSDGPTLAILAAGEGPGGYNPGALNKAAQLIQAFPRGQQAVAELVHMGVTGAAFYTYWKDLRRDQHAERVQTLAEAWAERNE